MAKEKKSPSPKSPRRRASDDPQVLSYRHADRRRNNPEVGMVDPDIPANEFAIPRMEPGKQRPIQSMEEARDWERRFIGEIKAGQDPRNPPNRPKKVNTEIRNVSELLDAYWERCVKPAGLRSAATVRSQITARAARPGRFATAPAA